MTTTSTPLLRIRNWDDNFENNRTRDMNRMAWIPVPNRHDSDGYTVLVAHPNGAAHLGAWLVILQVASKCDPRGTLMRDSGRPHDAGTISRLTRLPEQIILDAIDRLCSEEIGWLEVVDSEGNLLTPQEGAGLPHPDAETPQEGIPLGKEGTERTEGMEYSANQPSGDVAGQTDFLLSKRKRKLQGTKQEWFKQFWDAFNDKRGRAEAIDAWLDIAGLNESLAKVIIKAAEIEARNRQAIVEKGQTSKMAQGWLSGRRWEDEIDPNPNAHQPERITF